VNLLVQNYKTNLKQNIRIIWSGISLMADYLAVLLAEMIAIYFSEENLRYIDLFIVIPFIYIAFIAAARTYRRIIPFWQRVESLFYSSIYSIIAILLFFFVRANATEHSIAFLALLWLASFICLVIMRYLLKRILDERNIFQIPLLIIGAQEEALAFVKAINSDIGMSSYKIVGLISDKTPVKGLENYPLLGDFKDMEKTIKTTGVNNVLIAIPYLEQAKIQNIIHRVQPLVKNICIIPNLQAIPMGGADLETFLMKNLC
jgi:FlaA1/EpsC-like NDP-sugar epimerase